MKATLTSMTPLVKVYIVDLDDLDHEWLVMSREGCPPRVGEGFRLQYGAGEYPYAGDVERVRWHESPGKRPEVSVAVVLHEGSWKRWKNRRST